MVLVRTYIIDRLWKAGFICKMAENILQCTPRQLIDLLHVWHLLTSHVSLNIAQMANDNVEAVPHKKSISV